MTPDTPPSPWAGSDVRTLTLLTLAACAGILTSWTVVSGEGVARAQTAWLAVGIGALVLLGTASAFWLMAGRSVVAARRNTLLRQLVALLPDGLLTPTASTAPPVAADDELVWVTGTRRYHRPSCLLTAGKPVQALDAAAHEAADRAPCEVCAP